MPQITVIEGLSLGGYADRENDDAYGATKAVAFVLDGVTSLAETPVMPGRSDAAWAARTARELLTAQGAHGSDLRALVTTVAEGITARFEAERVREPCARYELPWTTMSLIGVEAGRLNIAYVGDSRILVETDDDEIHNFGVNPSRSAFEANLAAKMIASRKGKAPDLAAVLPELRAARNTVNTGAGYWLLGADASVGAHATVTSLALLGPATVLLATDGFYALVEDYARYGDRELIATAQTIGLAALMRELRHIEDGDPNGERFPRMKKSDDATALLVRVEP
jgi:serine/threonine protein phosphatase PrpC